VWEKKAEETDYRKWLEQTNGIKICGDRLGALSDGVLASSPGSNRRTAHDSRRLPLVVLEAIHPSGRCLGPVLAQCSALPLAVHESGMAVQYTLASSF
jgi:hypothetical protein